MFMYVDLHVVVVCVCVLVFMSVWVCKVELSVPEECVRLRMSI